MKLRLLFLSALALMFSCTRTVTLDSTLIRTSTADPCMVFDDGYFYLTMTGGSRIAIIKDKSLAGLGTESHDVKDNIVYESTSDPTVEEIYGEGAIINGAWSPELHYFSEEEFPGQSGWYMYLALKQKYIENDGRSSARNLRMCVLKSESGRVDGPYVSPSDGTPGKTQPFLKPDGTMVTDWCVGPSLLRIPSGKYRGVYLTWVEETGRGQGLGNFYQMIRISHHSSPWQLAGESSIVTTPTQEWEFHGADEIRPRVVEGGTAVYGDHGEVFLTYSGSGYWSDYGLGQLTLLREGNDYADPLKTESWVKYEGNPVFTSAHSDEITGAGHGFFLRDAAGGRFFCYHAYPLVNGEKVRVRNAYLEPYTIDYKAACPSAPYGVLRMGALGNGDVAPVATQVKFKMAR